MIPKIIHYCWFGNNPKTKLAKKCIKSWKKYCPGYQIIEWNESNFDISLAPLYVRQAYEHKKWAFVTDYVRLYAMFYYGGIYMDTDVEVIKPLDKFLIHQAFSGFEDEINIPTGIMASEKGFPLFKIFLDYYQDKSFINRDNTLDVTTNVTIITKICKEKGLNPNNTFQVIEGFALYPNDYFCPIDYDTKILKKTENTCTIHWFSGSWLTKKEKERQKERQKELKKILFIKRKNNVKHYVLRIPNRILKKLLGEDNYDKLKKKIKNKQASD